MPNCNPAPEVPRSLSAEYLARDPAAPVTAEATLAPGANARPKEPISPASATKSLVSASVQLSEPMSPNPDAFVGLCTLASTLLSDTP